MNHQVIIAGWMSPIKIRKFSECNIVINTLMLFMQSLVFQYELSEVSRCLFEELFHRYGVTIFCMAVFLLLLSKVSSLNGIDRDRVFRLVVLGILDLEYALAMSWR